MQDGSAIEVATVGNEGVVGLLAYLGGETSPNEVMVQVEGDGVRIRIDALKEAASRPGSLADLMLRYHTAYLTQISQQVACNGLHPIQQRCCRWLLLTQDRVGSNELSLTHEFLGVMLGVRRASVTEVLRPLQEEGLVQQRPRSDHHPEPEGTGAGFLRVLPGRPGRIQTPSRLMLDGLAVLAAELTSVRERRKRWSPGFSRLKAGAPAIAVRLMHSR